MTRSNVSDLHRGIKIDARKRMVPDHANVNWSKQYYQEESTNAGDMISQNCHNNTSKNLVVHVISICKDTSEEMSPSFQNNLSLTFVGRFVVSSRRTDLYESVISNEVAVRVQWEQRLPMKLRILLVDE